MTKQQPSNRSQNNFCKKDGRRVSTRLPKLSHALNFPHELTGSLSRSSRKSLVNFGHRETSGIQGTTACRNSWDIARDHPRAGDLRAIHVPLQSEHILIWTGEKRCYGKSDLSCDIPIH